MMQKVKISDFAEVITGGTPSTSVDEYWDNGTIPWLQSGACQNCVIKECDTFITEEGLKNSAAKMMKPESVLIALTGATTGKVGYLTFEACANQSVTGIQPNNKYLPKYLYYYLMGIRQKILDDSYGGAQKHISQGYVKNLEVPLGTIEEQRTIVNAIEKVDAVISARKNELQLFDDLIKARFVEMFGTPFINEKQWDMKTIGDVVTEVRYGTSRPAVENGKYSYLRMNNLTSDGEIDLNNLKRIDIPEEEVEKCIVRKGDVLFNRTNSVELVGKTAMFNLDEDMIIAGYIIRIRLQRHLLPEILAQYMNLKPVKDLLRSMAKGAVNQANINAQELQSIKVYIPDIERQIEFVSFKRQVDKSKFAVQQALEKSQLLFDSLMQKYFG